VSPDKHIIALTTQLLRAEDPAVVKTVAEMLHIAINQYVQDNQIQTPILAPWIKETAA
jgi:hypothetical protein